MKRIKIIIGKAGCCFAAVICCFAFYGCKTEYDQMYVKDSNGKMYQLEWIIGDCYFVHEVTMPENWAK